MTFNAENTTYSNDQTFAISNNAGPVKALGGTHMSVTAYADIERQYWKNQLGQLVRVFSSSLATILPFSRVH